MKKFSIFLLALTTAASAQTIRPDQVRGTAIVQTPTGSQSAGNLNGLINVNTFAGATTADKTLAAQTFCGASTPGCTLILPPGMVAGAIPGSITSSPMAATSLIDDQRYLNSASPFYGFLAGSHSFHEYTQSVGPLATWELNPSQPFTGPGIIAMQAVANADAGPLAIATQGEIIPLMIQVERNTGSHRFITGGNINMGANTLTNQANALELDCNNKTLTDDTTPQIHCLQIIGGSAAHPGTALQITALGSAASSWLTAMDVTRYHNVGLNLSNGDAGRLADIQIVPPDDLAANTAIKMFKADRSALVFVVRDDGSLNTTKLIADRIGGPGLQITSNTGCSISAGTIGAGCTVNVAMATPSLNTNYAPTCSVIDGTGGPNYIGNIHIIDPSNFQVTENAGSTVSTGGGTIRCIIGNN